MRVRRLRTITVKIQQAKFKDGPVISKDQFYEVAKYYILKPFLARSIITSVGGQVAKHRNVR
jgi:hypothetical protein